MVLSVALPAKIGMGWVPNLNHILDVHQANSPCRYRQGLGACILRTALVHGQAQRRGQQPAGVERRQVAII